MNWGTAADAASRAWARRTQLSTRTPPFTGCGRNTGGSGDSDTFTKARRNLNNDVRPGGPPDDCHVIRYEGAQPGRPSGPGHLPGPRTGTRIGTQPPRARAPTAQNNTSRSLPTYVPTAVKLLLENMSQVSRSRNSEPTIRTGRTRTPKLDGTFYGQHRRQNNFKSARDSHPATNLESILCGPELATNANISKPYKHTPYFRNLPRSPLLRPSQGRNSLRLIQALPVKPCRLLLPLGTFLPVGTAHHPDQLCHVFSSSEQRPAKSDALDC
jgi:hypothetical protein